MTTKQSNHIDLQRRLLSRTIREASQYVPFYRRHWSQVEDLGAIKDLPDLEKLPPLDRADLTKGDLLREGMAAHVMIHSSGSTGHPFVRFRGQEELSAMESLARRIANVSPERAQRKRFLFTTIEATLHGGGVNVPLPVLPINISVRSRWLIDCGIALMLRDPIMPGFDKAEVEINGRPRHLMILANELAKKVGSEELPRSRVVQITSSGYGLTNGMRAMLSRTFPNASITETYSLSEIIGGAMICQDCGHYHFSAQVIGEVVEIGGYEGVDDVGRLLVTELFPFSQLQPFIRYNTGDLVRKIPTDCSKGLAFEFVGRQKQTPAIKRDGKLSPLVSIWVLGEVLEMMSDVARGTLGTRLAPPYDQIQSAAPHAEAVYVPVGSGALKIRVGINFSHSLEPERAEKLKHSIIKVLSREDKLFAQTMSSGLPTEIELCETGNWPPTLNLGK